MVIFIIIIAQAKNKISKMGKRTALDLVFFWLFIFLLRALASRLHYFILIWRREENEVLCDALDNIHHYYYYRY